jgi:hypothetical protein
MAQAHLAGKTVACPTCQQPLRVPSFAPAKSAPAKSAPAGRAAPAAKPAPARPADDFWDALLPPKDPQEVAAASLPPPVEEPVTGHQATALAIGLLSRGLSPRQVRGQLIERGVSQVETDRVVDALVPGEAKSKPQAATGTNSGMKNMAIGAIVCLIGLAVTIGSYVAAEPGGVFLLAYGPVIFGGIQFVRGCIQLTTGSA